MEAVELLFRLLLLPEKVQKYVIRNMETIEIVSFSLASKAMALLVETSNIRVAKFQTQVSEQILISMMFRDYFSIYFFEDPAGNYFNGRNIPDVIPIADSITLTQNDGMVDDNNEQLWRIPRVVTWQNSKSVKEWLSHLSIIFHCNKVELTFTMTEDLFQKESVDDVFRGFQIEKVHVVTNKCPEMIKMLLPRTESLRIAMNPFGPDDLAKVLMMNFQKLEISLQEFTFDQFLMAANSKELFLMNFGFNERELNMFLKLWRNGSFQKLVNLTIYVDTERIFDNELIYKGIEWQDATPEAMRADGFAIKHLYRNDGTMAETLTWCGNGLVRFRLDVKE